MNQTSATLNNAHGNIGASGDIAVTVASLDNSGGQIGNTAGDGGGIALSSSGNVSNTAGNIGSDKNLSINANTITGDGKVIAGQDLTLNLQGDYTNATGNLFTANRDLNFNLTGTLTNAGNLESVRNLSLTAANFNNQYGALVNAGNGNTLIKTTNAVYNLGRIYGDDVAIAAQNFTNDGVLNADGSTKQAGVIASRGDLNIGATSVFNLEGALLYSDRNLAIGRTLDSNHQATGVADQILNQSARIEAAGNMQLSASNIVNRNNHFAFEQRVISVTPVVQYQLDGQAKRWDASEIVERTCNPNNFNCLYMPDGSHGQNYTIYKYQRSISRTFITNSKPGEILAGGNLVVSGNALNEDSRIVVGGSLSGAPDSLTNNQSPGYLITTDTGTAQHTYTRWHGGATRKRKRHWDGELTYQPAAVTQDSPVAIAADSAVSPNIGGGVDNNIVPSSGSSNIGGNQGGRDVSGNGQTVDAAVVPGAPIPNLVLPNSQLFQITHNPGLGYLIETDPKFTNYRTFLSSDYLLGRLAFDPQKVQKRLGDGFYEQKLINDQIAELTGRRFLGSYSSNEEQYKALMESGVASAQQFQLTPGISLSAAQMAALTSDIVWLVSQDVKLPDGGTTSVLVPVVYLARANASDIRPDGALISASNLDLKINGSLQNGGTLQASNNTLIHATDIINAGNIRSNAQTGATLLVADNDLTSNGGKISGNRVGILAGRDVAITTTTSSGAVSMGDSNRGFSSEHTVINKVASINADQLSIQSGRDIHLNAASIATTGDAALMAGRDLNLNAITSKQSIDLNYDSQNHLRQSQTQVNGSSIQSGGNLSMSAGQDINATAAYANAGGALTAVAGRDINLSTAQQDNRYDQEIKRTSSGVISSSSTHIRDIQNSSQAIGTTFSGDSVQLAAKRDINVTGSNVVGTNDVALVAGNNINLLATQNTTEQSYSKEEKKSGMFSSGGIGVTIGKQEQQSAQTSKQLIHSGSTVGSTDGNTLISAGNAYIQTGSNVLAPKGDIGIVAKSVDINAAIDTMSTTQDSKFKQSGVTVAVTNPVISAVQTGQQMNRASSQTSDGRMQVLAGSVTALSGYNAYNDVVADKSGTAGGVNISISLGSSKSQSHSEQHSTTAQGSTVAAGGNLNVIATGGGKDSNIDIISSNISAGNNAKLIADNNINLQAAQSTYEQHSTNSSSSASIGVGVGTNTGFTVNASASMGRGKADGSDVSYTNTHVNAGNQLVIASGGDTNLKGATASAHQVIAAVGGNLNIESLQDTSIYNSTQKNIGVGVTIPIGMGAGGVNVSGGKSKIDSNFQGVGEQSGIKAGDGGFDVYVKGNTDLKGAVIASTDKAVQDTKNSFVTGSLTQSDIQNQAHYDAKSVSVTTGVGTQPAGSQGTGVGFGTDGGDASSTSQSGISGIAGNTDVRTGDKETGIGKIFDQGKVQKDIDAQTQITLAFSQQAPKAIGTFSDQKAKELRAQGNEEEAKDWDEGGKWRGALHTAAGALSGGIAGALGAGAVASAAPLLTDLQNNVRDGLINAGVDPTTAILTSQAIALGTAAGMGALVSGGSTAGTGMGLAVDANNRQLHSDEETWIRNNAQRYATQKGIRYDQAVQKLTAQGDRQVQNGSPGAWDTSASKFLSEARGMLPAEGNSGISYMFSATVDQKANPNMYAYSPYYGLQGMENWPLGQNAANSANRDQAFRQLAGAGTIVAPAASIMLLGAPIASAIGGVAIYSAIGATASGGMDAAGQYAQTGQIRPVQSLFAASVGAVVAPIGATTNFINNVLLGGGGAALNTTFNNAYYGESYSPIYSAAMGGLFGAAGYTFGLGVTKALGQTMPANVYINLNTKIPALFQSTIVNPMPGIWGSAGGSVVGGGASFTAGKESPK